MEGNDNKQDKGHGLHAIFIIIVICILAFIMMSDMPSAEFLKSIPWVLIMAVAVIIYNKRNS